MKPTPDYRLYLVTDTALAGARPIEDLVARAVAGGVTLVQLREKQLAARAFLARAEGLRRRLAALGVPLIVNDRPDIALAAGAAGVHLGQGDLPCSAVRRVVGDALIIGVSVSTPDEARRAVDDGADYLAASPVFATPTKSDAPPAVGLAGLRRIAAAARVPVVAIGGLSAANAAKAMRAGAAGVAVVSAIMAAADPAEAAAALRRAVDEGRRARAAPGEKPS